MSACFLLYREMCYFFHLERVWRQDRPPPTLSFADQFAFRPSGSTSAALVALLHTFIQALEANPYVVVVALDFKAFDTVHHRSVMAKVAQMNLPDNVDNWLANFLE